MGSIRRDSMLLYSISEPNLILSSESQVCDADARTKFSHTDEQLHASGPVSRLLPLNGRTRLIRFQSHVRITSGISRPHKKTTTSHVVEIDMSMSPRSSPSSSRASSVYAPLRSRSDDENPRSSLGMAHRVRKAAMRGRRRSRDNEKIKERCLCELEQAGKRGSSQISNSNERTPLLNCTIQSVFEREGTDFIADDRNLSHAVDFIFGTWPGRLLNRHVRTPCSTEPRII